ncbi:hypothetical protein [Algoriphagus winogradskyi]|nr:hypothetical protein [Algoriphagus winogradskyi]
MNFLFDYEAIYYAVIPGRNFPIGFGFAVSEVGVEVEIAEGVCEQSTFERKVSVSISMGFPPYIRIVSRSI